MSVLRQNPGGGGALGVRAVQGAVSTAERARKGRGSNAEDAHGDVRGMAEGKYSDLLEGSLPVAGFVVAMELNAGRGRPARASALVDKFP